MKKHILLLALFLPILAFGSSYNGIKDWDAFLCKKRVLLERTWSNQWCEAGNILHITDTPWTRWGDFYGFVYQWDGKHPIFYKSPTYKHIKTNDTLCSFYTELTGNRGIEYHSFSSLLKNGEFFQYLGNTESNPNL